MSHLFNGITISLRVNQLKKGIYLVCDYLHKRIEGSLEIDPYHVRNQIVLIEEQLEKVKKEIFKYEEERLRENG